MAEPKCPYPAEPGLIGISRDGAKVELAPMTGEAACLIGAGLAAIDPWHRVAISADRLVGFLATVEAAAPRYVIAVDGATAGTMVVRHPWLHGPYLNLLGLLPGYEGRGIGSLALHWFEVEARGQSRNLWLCVSRYNHGARRLYERHGFVLAATLDDLAFDGYDELLMRKLLT